MLIRFMLFGYALIACAVSFHIGHFTSFYSDGILLDTPYVTYWLDYGVTQ